MKDSNVIPTMRPIQRADFETLAALAQQIWREHYSTIISREQIEYMLSGRFSATSLARYIDSDVRWFDVLEVNGAFIGYCSYARTTEPREMKLEQLYLLPELHGQGFGKFMLNHAEARAVALGCESLMLQVKKKNKKALQVYRGSGFELREEVVVDIGNGFVMDDFIMAKRLL